ncbi:MAG TPA: hypothetical protein VJO33_12015 [Gemmatimonadaceae bacterium]|nr:hypothetical protein [Gemmatimonadaceae bacterium]
MTLTHCRRRKYRNRGTTPLYWLNAPFTVIQNIYLAARKAVPWTHASNHDRAMTMQPWLRKVSVEFHRRLREAQIYVEGSTNTEGVS